MGKGSEEMFRDMVNLWYKGSDIPINQSEEIEAEWAGFPPGTPREKVWRWFEEQHSEFRVAEAMQGNYSRYRE